MTLNEFKTHMLLMNWGHHTKVMSTPHTYSHIWKMSSHIFQLTSHADGSIYGMVLFKNWNKSKQVKKPPATRLYIQGLEEAIRHIEKLS